MNPFIEQIHSFPSQGEGMDVILISCATEAQAQFWESHLKAQRGSLIKKNAAVCALVEDWPGGAGNGFGTLYALKKAKERLGALQGSVAVYHTAGKGTRLAPLTLAENNNKPGVLLPALLPNDPHQRPLSILEMVIRQTAPLAPLMQDRIAVFWSDQLFIPSMDMTQAPQTDVEVLAKRATGDWRQYGLVSFKGQLFNKVTPEQFQALDLEGDIGINMGSFSLSQPFAEELMEIFRDNLENRCGTLDTDTHLWMPATLSKAPFLLLRPHDEPHYERVRTFLKPEQFSLRDIGAAAWWWDFGTLPNYYRNCMKLLDATAEGEALRSLFGNPHLVGTHLKECTVKESVLLHVDAEAVHFDRALCIGSALKQMSVVDSIVYRAQCCKEELADSVRTDVGGESFYANLDQNSWEEVVRKNPCSFAEQYDRNLSKTQPLRPYPQDSLRR